MRFFLMILWAVIIITVIYYITWAIHVVYQIFGKWIDPVKALIPFYGWIKWFKGPKYFQ